MGGKQPEVTTGQLENEHQQSIDQLFQRTYRAAIVDPLYISSWLVSGKAGAGVSTRSYVTPDAKTR